MHYYAYSSTTQGTIVKYVPDSNGDNDNDVMMIQSMLGSLSSASVVTELATRGTAITDTIGMSKVGQPNKNVHKVSANKCIVNAITIIIWPHYYYHLV
jgi:hypothetical protein